MIPPVLRRFLLEDYPDAPAWFGRFIQVLNSFMEQTVQLFDRNISFGDNIQARSFSTTFTTAAAYGTGTFTPITFSWSVRSQPLAVLITSIRHADGTPFNGSVGTPAWTYVNGNINVTYIPGLVATSKYSVSFLAF